MQLNETYWSCCKISSHGSHLITCWVHKHQFHDYFINCRHSFLGAPSILIAKTYFVSVPFSLGMNNWNSEKWNFVPKMKAHNHSISVFIFLVNSIWSLFDCCVFGGLNFRWTIKLLLNWYRRSNVGIKRILICTN